MEWIHSVLREGKLYGMIALIASIVWVAGYSARVDQRWRETEWMSALDHDPGLTVAELDAKYFDDADTPTEAK